VLAFACTLTCAWQPIIDVAAANTNPTAIFFIMLILLPLVLTRRCQRPQVQRPGRGEKPL